MSQPTMGFWSKSELKFRSSLSSLKSWLSKIFFGEISLNWKVYKHLVVCFISQSFQTRTGKPISENPPNRQAAHRERTFGEHGPNWDHPLLSFDFLLKIDPLLLKWCSSMKVRVKIERNNVIAEILLWRLVSWSFWTEWMSAYQRTCSGMSKVKSKSKTTNYPKKIVQTRHQTSDKFARVHFANLSLSLLYFIPVFLTRICASSLPWFRH